MKIGIALVSILFATTSWAATGPLSYEAVDLANVIAANPQVVAEATRLGDFNDSTVDAENDIPNHTTVVTYSLGIYRNTQRTGTLILEDAVYLGSTPAVHHYRTRLIAH